MMDGLQIGFKVLMMVFVVFVGAIVVASIDALIGFKFYGSLWVAVTHSVCQMIYGYFAIRLVVNTVKDLK